MKKKTVKMTKRIKPDPGPRIVMPVGIYLNAHRLPSGLWDVLYQEKFRKEDRVAADNLAKLSSAALPIEVNRRRDFIRIRIRNVGRQTIFNMLASEFICLSELGNLSLAKLLTMTGACMAMTDKARRGENIDGFFDPADLVDSPPIGEGMDACSTNGCKR